MFFKPDKEAKKEEKKNTLQNLLACLYGVLEFVDIAL